MKLQTIAGALLALAVAASPALACTGDEIFADDFSDPLVSADMWGKGDYFSIGSGYLEIKVEPRYTGQVTIPGSQKEFDLCFDVTFPDAKEPDGGTWGGLIFWFKDWANHYEIALTPAGAAGPIRVVKERYLQLTPFKGYDAIKKGAGATNSMRFTLKGNTGTVYANGQRLFAFKTIAADALDHVAFAASSEEAGANAWRFSNIKLTEPPK